MAEELERALREVRDKLLSNPVSPRVEDPADINLHYCRYVAETVAERLGEEYGVRVLEDGGRGFMHTWIWYDGRHYDAECIEGVPDHRDLPFFERHPESAVHVEPETTDGASLRNRGREPLYPAMFSPEAPIGLSRVGSTTYLRHVAVGVLLGLFIFAIGMGGEWAMHRHLLRQTAELHGLFVDLEVVGELIALVSPIIFFVLLPAHRASSR